MPRFFAFLRAINVGGHTVEMGRLRRLFESLGFLNVETFIASGNVVFETRSRIGRGLETRIEEALRAALGYDVSTFVRTHAELADIARYRPFRTQRLDDAVALNVAFLARPLEPNSARTLMALRTDIDDFDIRGREIYWLCRTRQSASTFSNAVLERTIRGRSTLRGVKTVKAMAAKYPLAGQ